MDENFQGSKVPFVLQGNNRFTTLGCPKSFFRFMILLDHT